MFLLEAATKQTVENIEPLKVDFHTVPALEAHNHKCSGTALNLRKHQSCSGVLCANHE